MTSLIKRIQYSDYVYNGLACSLLSARAYQATYGFMRDTIIGCYLAVGLMVFKDALKDSRPLIFWNAVGNVFRPWSALCLNDKGLLDFL